MNLYNEVLFSIVALGKMFGIESNYIIAEVEFKEGEDPHQDDGDSDSEVNTSCNFTCVQ